MEFSIKQDTLDTLVEAIKSSGHGDFDGFIKEVVLKKDAIRKPIETYREQLSAIARQKEITLESVCNEMMRNYIAVNWQLQHDECGNLFDKTAAQAMQDRQTEQLYNNFLDNEIRKRHDYMLDLLDQVTIPLLTKASHSLEVYQFETSISEITKTNTLSDITHYEAKMRYTDKTTGNNGNITFIASPKSGKIGARASHSSNPNPFTYDRISAYSEDVSSHIIEIINDFIKHTI